MPRLSGGILGFPDFRGFTRQLVLWNLGAFFLLLILHAVSAPAFDYAVAYIGLIPAMVLHGFVWQLATYWIINLGILNTAFVLLSLWFLGSFLEDQHGARWLGEIFFISVLGGGLAGLALGAFSPAALGTPVLGCWSGITGLMIAFGVLYADMEFMMFPLPIMIKAKHITAVYLLIMVAMLFFPAERMFGLSQLGGGLFGYLYIKFAPRRGFAFAGAESLYGIRNNYYRWKRRRAAKKFEVYMRKHRDN